MPRLPGKIKTAVIGCGRIGSLLEEDSLREKPCTHAGAMASNADCELTAGCDIDGERRRLFAEKWQVPVYCDAAEMIREHNPQILAVATHPDTHYQYCRLAAAMGVKVVICEKPLADNIREARKIAGLANRKTSGRNTAGDGMPVIITNHERRYSGDYIKAREILAVQLNNPNAEGRKLGRLLSVRAALYMGENKRLVDVLWHDGTHLADAIMFLSGCVLRHKRRWGAKLSSREGTAWLEAELRREKKPAVVPVLIEIGAGRDHGDPAPIPVLIEIGAGRDHLVFEIEFSCERGRLRIGNGIYEIWESAPSPYAEKFLSLKLTSDTFEGPTGYFANMVQDAVACFNETGREPRSSAADGMRVIEYLNSVKTP